jgi:hypothetical protein
LLQAVCISSQCLRTCILLFEVLHWKQAVAQKIQSRLNSCTTITACLQKNVLCLGNARNCRSFLITKH